MSGWALHRPCRHTSCRAIVAEGGQPTTPHPLGAVPNLRRLYELCAVPRHRSGAPGSGLLEFQLHRFVLAGTAPRSAPADLRGAALPPRVFPISTGRASMVRVPGARGAPRLAETSFCPAASARGLPHGPAVAIAPPSPARPAHGSVAPRPEAGRRPPCGVPSFGSRISRVRSARIGAAFETATSATPTAAASARTPRTAPLRVSQAKAPAREASRRRSSSSDDPDSTTRPRLDRPPPSEAWGREGRAGSSASSPADARSAHRRTVKGEALLDVTKSRARRPPPLL